MTRLDVARRRLSGTTNGTSSSSPIRSRLCGKYPLLPTTLFLNLELGRRRADVNDLVRHLHELLEIQRPIIERARQAKAVFDQHRLARPVAFVHPADLRDRGVRLVDHEQEILREKIEQREWLRARRASGEMPRIIFDPVAKSHLLQHLEIVLGAHFQPLRFEQLRLRFELDDAMRRARSRIERKRAIQLVRRRDELLRRIKRDHA